jgi:NAD-dependent dihydropyrimidine dehydrogenase PreA subunit
MANKIRKIVKIDDAKCTGCGECIISCAEGALKIIDGKARLMTESYCDGLGACLGKCPQGAITIEERPAAEFNEAEAKQNLAAASAARGCPGSAVHDLSAATQPASRGRGPSGSLLMNWPVQLALIPPTAPFLKNADILLAADCVLAAYSNFQEDFVKNRVLIIACPKLDNFEEHKTKLINILKTAHPKSLTVIHMEVPCCSGLVFMAREAIKAGGTNVPLHEVNISIRGEVK